MDRLHTIEMFLAVADRGSFAGAARALQISPPVVTRGISELEARLGAVLFHRSTRAVSLTDEGAGFVDRAKRILADLADAERSLSGTLSEPQGTFQITASVIFGQMHVLPVIADLIDRYPALDVRMMLVDRNIRVIEEGIDVAVRIGSLANSSLRTIRIGTVRPMIVASPAYLARHGVPASASALQSHRLIASSGPRAATEWRFDGRKTVPAKPRIVLNTVAAAVFAAEAGVGLANFLDYQVEDAIDAGRLIEVLKPDQPEWLPVSLLFEASRSNLPSARAFIEAMRAHAAHCGWGRSP
ncbi:LysR family transcriptional regulator [Sphingorhabdus sp. IMCC26285]|uniref:LysR family transcriptional regulator n=1 Tax=Sphingorhabdus profundilacus TaxID=2509718 RepID=A0A6I4M1J6_9SPHN|nr:LysR substrate-binding domain-containing protein [Sphingorhabdus profundilacus]MVZ96318.1 LysR family transcriptional regulator [Sphingorhabdus profundilacus]